jgi:DNA-binding LacI/PurR family transcriptional regulator
MAITAMDVARSQHGLLVPQDVSIVGFDDAPPAAWPAYALTTFAQPVLPMVEATVALILERLADPDAPPRRIVVPGHLVLRGSCRLPPAMEPSA